MDVNEKTMRHIEETLTHKTFVIQSCLKMSKYLEEKGKRDLAVALLQRASIHDNSKLKGPELELLSGLSGKQDAFVDPSVQLSEKEKTIIEKHWENNRHHPEHFEHPEEMSELDILEMVCDWHARSSQYDTKFLEFVKNRQETRFHFPEEMFKKIWYYCEMING